VTTQDISVRNGLLGSSLGQYRIEGLIGSGGMATVFKAYQPILRRHVALKVLHNQFAQAADFSERFRREARIVAQLDHPNILQIYDFGEAGGVVFIVMPLVGGGTLKDHITHSSSVRWCIQVLVQLAGALDYAHANGVIHRDVKPSNILLGLGGHPLLADFGIARALSESKGLTRTGLGLGTPEYLSPEQGQGHLIDGRTDQYALAMTMYEMLTGILPFQGQSPLETVMKQVNEPVPSLCAVRRDLPSSLDAVIQRALAKRAEDRFPDMRDFATALEQAFDFAPSFKGQVDSSGQGIGPSLLPPTIPIAGMTLPYSHVHLESGPPIGVQHGPSNSPGLNATSIATTHSNLPNDLTSFVGRKEQIVEVSQLLHQHRLVTLTGPGGSGKTRLALKVARNQLGAYADGIWLVELAGLTDPFLLAQEISAVLGIKEQTGHSPADILASYLSNRTSLLVLDNCEHLVSACAELVSQLLSFCSNLRILATSREALRTPGESVWPVPALAVQQEGKLPSIAELGRVEAIQLFVERVVASMPSFALTKENGADIVEICRRVDGIPLAIELAAARVKSLSVNDIAQRIGNRFQLLTGGSRTVLPRHQTLRALVDWSYELLDEFERRVFISLSVFAGGWTLSAGEAVCGADSSLPKPFVDYLASLVEKSLVVAQPIAEGGIRYRLLETLREYGRELLVGAPEVQQTFCRHYEWFREFAEQGQAELSGPQQLKWLRSFDVEHDNLRAALTWALEQGEVELALGLTGCLWRFWWIRGHGSEGRKWIERTGLYENSVPSQIHARAMHSAALMAITEGDYGYGSSLLREELKLRRRLNDNPGTADALLCLGMVAHQQGEFTSAQVLSEEALELFKQLGNNRRTATALNNLAVANSAQGNYAFAEELLNQSLSISHEFGDQYGIARSLVNLARAAYGQGDLSRARQEAEDSLVLRKELGDPQGIGSSLITLARIALAENRLSDALSHCQQVVYHAQTLKDQQLLMQCFGILAGTAARLDRSQLSRRLLAWEEALRLQRGVKLTHSELADAQQTEWLLAAVSDNTAQIENINTGGVLLNTSAIAILTGAITELQGLVEE
jgi:predicted ATPase/tRNA A-37 threonylcarbamoyl transferase component Bud32